MDGIDENKENEQPDEPQPTYGNNRASDAAKKGRKKKTISNAGNDNRLSDEKMRYARETQLMVDGGLPDVVRKGNQVVSVQVSTFF